MKTVSLSCTPEEWKAWRPLVQQLLDADIISSYQLKDNDLTVTVDDSSTSEPAAPPQDGNIAS